MAPLIVFVHVPKAGGSTVNAHLKAHFGAGLPHCEHLLTRPKRLAKALKHVPWVSAHLDGPRLRAALASHTERPQRLFACVREPLSHVASHYNWIMRLPDRSYLRYLRHPKDIRALSRAMRAADPHDAEAVISILRAHPQHFSNLQWRYVLEPSIYEALMPMEALPSLIAKMTDSKAQSTRQANKSPYRLNQTIFQSEAVRAFLDETNAKDAALYASLRGETV